MKPNRIVHYILKSTCLEFVIRPYLSCDSNLSCHKFPDWWHCREGDFIKWTCGLSWIFILNGNNKHKYKWMNRKYNINLMYEYLNTCISFITIGNITSLNKKTSSRTGRYILKVKRRCSRIYVERLYVSLLIIWMRLYTYI